MGQNLILRTRSWEKLQGHPDSELGHPGYSCATFPLPPSPSSGLASMPRRDGKLTTDPSHYSKTAALPSEERILPGLYLCILLVPLPLQSHEAPGPCSPDQCPQFPSSRVVTVQLANWIQPTDMFGLVKRVFLQTNQTIGKTSQNLDALSYLMLEKEPPLQKTCSPSW